MALRREQVTWDEVTRLIDHLIVQFEHEFHAMLLITRGGIPFTSVLHFNPHRNLFGSTRPDYFAASTDAHIVYPWEQEPTAGWAKRDY